MIYIQVGFRERFAHFLIWCYHSYMKRLLLISLLICILLVFVVNNVSASSSQAYQDYLYQFDVYRANYNSFKVAQNEYFKFQTLTSQQTALTATVKMMSQRDVLLKTYLLLLNEKLNESSGITASDRNYYQSLIQNENIFLNNHATLVTSVATLQDAANVGRQLEDHYNVLQGSMLQIISGISLGNLTGFANTFDKNLADAKALVSINRGIFSAEKQSLLDRWLLQITNTRSLYQTKIDDINLNISKLKVSNSSYGSVDPTQLYATIKQELGGARQYLLDGSSYMGELVRELRYLN